MNLVSGWVWKRKSEGKLSRLLNQFNKRYLTIDFTKEAFFYSGESFSSRWTLDFSSEGGSSDVMSRPYPFNDLLSAYAISSPEAYRSAVGKTFRNLKVGNESWTPDAQHGICVQTRQKEFELYFLSAYEVNMWLQGFERALQIAEVQRGAQLEGIAATTPPLELSRGSGGSSATASTAASLGESSVLEPPQSWAPATRTAPPRLVLDLE